MEEQEIEQEIRQKARQRKRYKGWTTEKELDKEEKGPNSGD